MSTEVERIFELLSKLKEEQPYTSVKANTTAEIWRVNFRGNPSFRHANRIGIFRDFLDSLVPGHLQTIAGRTGSVVVHFAPEDESTQGYREASAKLVSEKENFSEIAELLGISSLSFNGVELEF